MTPITIRSASLADSRAISSLTVQLGYRASGSEISERLEILLNRPDCFIAVAEAAGVVVGWVAAEHRTLLESGPRVEIVGLVVAKRQRRSGIGSALVAAAEQWQKERGVSTIFLRSNIARPESHPFFERLGYSRHKTQHAYIKHVDR